MDEGRGDGGSVAEEVRFEAEGKASGHWGFGGKMERVRVWRSSLFFFLCYERTSRFC